MPVKSLDRRARMTREILKQSLIELMHDKPIHEISIKKICETADVNRSTFYHHYDSQYELFNDILNDVGNDISEIVKKHLNTSDVLKLSLIEIFTYIEKNQELFLVIFCENSGFSVGETLTSYVEHFFRVNDAVTSEIAKYYLQFATAGMTSVIWQWLNAEERMSATELANVITHILAPSFSKLVFLPF